MAGRLVAALINSHGMCWLQKILNDFKPPSLFWSPHVFHSCGPWHSCNIPLDDSNHAQWIAALISVALNKLRLFTQTKGSVLPPHHFFYTHPRLNATIAHMDCQLTWRQQGTWLYPRYLLMPLPRPLCCWSLMLVDTNPLPSILGLLKRAAAFLTAIWNSQLSRGFWRHRVI